MDREYKAIRWSKYTLPNGRAVYLTQRPDRAEKSSVRDFIKETKPLVRFVFCDDLVKPLRHLKLVPWHWFPWVPLKNIPIENVFAFISSMNHYNLNQAPQKQSIWLHCDSSSMRAPTYFGLYLFAVYPGLVKEITDGMTVNPGGNYDYAKISCAKSYADVAIKEEPGVKDLITAWNKGGEDYAYTHYMGRVT